MLFESFVVNRSLWRTRAAMSDDLCVVLVTVPHRDEGERIASALIAGRLAACCNLVPSVLSIYRWEGKICRDEELLLVIKTRRASFEQLRKRVRQLHSALVPEIIVLPIVGGDAPYLDWVRSETEE